MGRGRGIRAARAPAIGREPRIERSKPTGPAVRPRRSLRIPHPSRSQCTGAAGARGATSRVTVRSREGGLALEVDGTWASWRRPGRSATGSVWDALALPLLALPRKRRRTALLLGLGAGSVARVLRALAPTLRITGVERDPAVIEAARRSFGLAELGVELHLGDAAAFLARTRRRFDLVIDDVFVGAGAAPRKPDWLPVPGLERAARRLQSRGVLVSNSLDETAEVRGVQCRLWPRVVELRIDGFDNRIFAGTRGPLEARSLRRALAAESELADLAKVLRLRTIRRGER